jgi:hypothetical protein
MENVMRLAFPSVLLAALLAASSAMAQTCEQNFEIQGTPMLTPVVYKTWGAWGRVSQAAALDKVARAVAAEGFDGVKVNKGLGAVDAMQEMSGSGRPQFVRFVVRKQGNGVRVDATFRIQAGQVSPEDAVRQALCRVIAEAAN